MSCGVCYRECEGIKLKCSCQFCEECIANWILAQIADLKYRKKSVLRCMNTECRIDINPEQVIPQLNPTLANLLDARFLVFYSSKEYDIRSCPKEGCGYFGFIESSQAICEGQFGCDSCKVNWREPQAPRTGNSKNIEQNFKIFTNELLWEFYEYAVPQKCPRCQVCLVKNGGCNHMTCGYCSYEFCWDCFHDYKTHEKTQCQLTYYIRIFLWLLMMVCTITHILLRYPVSLGKYELAVLSFFLEFFRVFAFFSIIMGNVGFLIWISEYFAMFKENSEIAAAVCSNQFLALDFIIYICANLLVYVLLDYSRLSTEFLKFAVTFTVTTGSIYVMGYLLGSLGSMLEKIKARMRDTD